MLIFFLSGCVLIWMVWCVSIFGLLILIFGRFLLVFLLSCVICIMFVGKIFFVLVVIIFWVVFVCWIFDLLVLWNGVIRIIGCKGVGVILCCLDFVL